MKDPSKDRLFAKPLSPVPAFRFDEEVARVFDDMISRSVPGYDAVLSLIGEMAARFVSPHSRCYDLGCSLGAASLVMREQINVEGCEIVAVDNSPAMVARCRELLATQCSAVKVTVLEQDIEYTPINNASMVVLNFTLQFIAPERRQALIENIYQGLQTGGVLVLSEKIQFADKGHQHLMTELYHNFKRANGYSDLEIAQKRSALEAVLITDALSTHQTRLVNAGFRSADVWFQCFTFASLIAIK